MDFNNKLKIILGEVNKSGRILDLGCGNGLLLRSILLLTRVDLYPYGIDFLNISIFLAKNKLHKDYKNNFICENVINVSYPKLFFKYIIFDPTIFSGKDIVPQYKKFISNLDYDGKMIIIFAKDSFKKRKNDIFFLDFFKLMNFKRIDGLFYTIKLYAI